MKIRLYADVFSQRLWAFKSKTTMGKDTINGLKHISQVFIAPTTFMVDGGPHFNCDEVHAFCDNIGTHLHIIATYSPWINGLLEWNNGILLNALKQLCAPNLGEDEYEEMQAKDLPRNWPDHLDAAIKNLADHILPALKFSPNKLLLNTPTTIPSTDDPGNVCAPTDAEVLLHLSIVEQQCLDGYSSIIDHTAHRKPRFDTKVKKCALKNIIFKKGDLVQVHQTQWHNTLSLIKKLVPMWSIPSRTSSCLHNSYTLETLGGLPIEGMFNSRQLCTFKPRPGTKLALDELERLEMLDVLDRMNKEDEEMDMMGLDRLWESTHESWIGRSDLQGLLHDEGITLRKGGTCGSAGPSR